MIKPCREVYGFMRWKGYEKRRQKSRWMAAGLAALMTMAAVCGCGSGENEGRKGEKADGSEGIVTGEDGRSEKYSGDGEAMGRYLEEESDLSEYLEGYRNHFFRLQDGKLVIAEPMQKLLVSEDNGATWTWEESDWLSPLIEEGNYIQSIAIGADGTKGVVYTLMDAAGGTAADGQDEDQQESYEKQDENKTESGGRQDEDKQESGEQQDEDKQESDEDQNESDNKQPVQGIDAAADAEAADDVEDPDASEDGQEDSFQESAGNEWWISPKSSVLVVKPDGTQLPVEFPAAEEEYPEHIWIADNGRIFLGTYGDVLYEVKEDGSCESFLTLENSPQMIAFQGSRMIIDGYEFDSLLIYDMETQEYISDEVLDTFVKENYGDRTFNGGSWFDLYCFPGGEDVIYLAGKKGVHRHVIGGGAMEQIIDASLSSFGNPARHLLGMVTLENNEFMAIFTDACLIRYVYDTTVPTVPNETVRAYSLTDNASLRQAISLFQAQNPEVYVEYEIGMEEGSAVTREDALKKLNTQIMAGQGPDFLILSDLPADSYIEKGLLADLGPLIDSLEGEEKLFDNVVDAFRKDGSLYTVPCDVNLPTILCREKYISDIQGLEDIADAMEKLRADNPGKDLLRVCSEKGVMKTFSVGYAPFWKTEAGEIDLQAVEQFLTQTKRIYDAQMDGLPQEIVEDYERRNEEYIEYTGTRYEDDTYFAYGMDDMNYTMGYRQFLAGTLGGLYGYAELTSVPRTKQFADCINVPMDGKDGSVFCVHTLAGISAVSEHQEHAEGLLKVLLGPESPADGFPVNQAAFEKELYPDDYESPDVPYSDMAYVEEDGKAYTWTIYWFDEAAADVLRSRIGSVNRAYVEDRALEEAVYQAGTAYMRGEMSVEEAVADVEKSMSIYMAE